MLCNFCGTDNEPGAAFCHGCGTPIRQTAQQQLCPGCGAPTPSGMSFCQNCGMPLGGPPIQQPGAPVQQPLPPNMYNPWYQQPVLPESNGRSVAGMVLGILSLMAWILPLIGYPLSITGLVLSIKGRQQTRGGIAKAGYVMSLIGLILTACNSLLGVLLS